MLKTEFKQKTLWKFCLSAKMDQNAEAHMHMYELNLLPDKDHLERPGILQNTWLGKKKKTT